MLKFVLGLSIIFSPFAHASVDAIGVPRLAWAKRKVHVCWHSLNAETDFKKEQKKAIQQIVEQEYTIDRVGITFVGWDECSSLSINEYDVGIYQDNDLVKSLTDQNADLSRFRDAQTEGTSSVGYVDSDQKQFVYLLFRPALDLSPEFSHLNATEELEMTSLHEFAHVAGLAHEHTRDEAKEDPNCIRWKSIVSEQLMDGSKNFEAYDPNSITNYCWNDAVLQNGLNVSELPNVPDKTLYTEVIDPNTNVKSYQLKIGLSAKDISTLNKMYPKM